MTAPMHDHRPVDRAVVARYWIPICRAVLDASRRPDPMKAHTAAMAALRKAVTR